MSNKWDKRYLELAKLVSTWSKDPRKQVGAVIVAGGYVQGLGFNGFPRGVADTPERLGTKEIKNLLMIHAEVNALHSSSGVGDTIYVWPCLPCAQCAGHIIQKGIKRVVTGPLDPDTNWNQPIVIEIFKEAGVELTILEALDGTTESTKTSKD